MQVKVRYLDNLKIEASFDDFTIIADQPIRYKGDGTAPGPYDYFLASSAMCAAYFVKVYCNTRAIPTDDIIITQDNIVDPENRYKQTIKIHAEIPESISDKDKKGIISSMDRCTVKRVIQNDPSFIINTTTSLKSENGLDYKIDLNSKTVIPGKDSSLEETISKMSKLIEDLGIKIEIASWRNIVPNLWSVHIRDADSPICFTNGKGATKNAALCSALGEYLERLSNNYFYNDFYLGEEISNSEFVHYPDEKWFQPEKDDELPSALMDETFNKYYNENNELKSSHLIDTNSGNAKRGVCAIPFIRQSDEKQIYIPVNLIGNIFVSNGMSAGNTKYEARVQALSEIFERAVKNQIILEEIALPDIPYEILKKYPKIYEAINDLESKGFPIYVKDASLGGKYPVICVTLMNPKTGGVFPSFGSHPNFEVALERSLTELMQGRSFEGLNDVLPPTFNDYSVKEHNNIVEHFIDSTGVISWKFFSNNHDYEFNHWNFTGTTQEEYSYLMNILNKLEKEVYIADYNELGAHACRILIPGYSEIYEAEDLIWDNHNKALEFRERILNIHSLSNEQINKLATDLVESDIDEQTLISELIGVAFDESSPWGLCTISEFKILCYIATENFELAKEQVEIFLAFNDNIAQRKKYYQIINIILDIFIQDELNIEHYKDALEKMYGAELLNIAIKSVSGEIKFFGLTETNNNCSNIDKHTRLIESYKKLQNSKSNFSKSQNI